MGHHLQAGKPSQYLRKVLSLAILLCVAAMTTRKSWGVNRYIYRDVKGLGNGDHHHFNYL